MRICFLTLDFPPFRSSGLTVYSENIVRGLAARGHMIKVIAAARPIEERVTDTLSLDNVSVERVPVGFMDWVGFGWGAARYLRSHQQDFDVIHFADIHFAYAYYGTFTATGLQSFRQRLTSHLGHPYHVGWKDYVFRLVYYNVARWTLEQPAAHRASHIAMISKATRREFIRYYGVSSQRTSVVYNPLDISRFEGLPTKEQARINLSQNINLVESMPILLYVGFSTPRKGVEYLACALEIMQTPVYLLMVGKWEADYKKRFLDVLGDNISRVYMAGYVSDAELLNYFAAADVFVLPSLLEGFGIPLAEAMAAGLPVVTTTGGAAAEVVGEAGVTVPPADSYALAVALDKVLSDQALARHMSKIGRARAFNLFDSQKAALKMERIFQRFSGSG